MLSSSVKTTIYFPRLLLFYVWVVYTAYKGHCSISFALHILLPYPCRTLAHWRYVQMRGRPLITRMVFPIYVHLLLPSYLKKVKQAIWVQGTGRHSVPVIEEIGKQDLHALSVYLGKFWVLVDSYVLYWKNWHFLRKGGQIFGFIADICSGQSSHMWM